MDEIVLSQVLDLLKKVGTASPTSGGLDTLFHALWQLNNYLSGGAAIPGLGQQGDVGSATGSANAKLVDIKSYLINTINNYLVNTVEAGIADLQSSRVGAQGDVASVGGSANAKLAALLQRVGGGTQHLFNQTVSIGATATTIINISGTGVIWSFQSLGLPAGLTNLTVTVDGVQIFNGNPVQPQYIVGPIKFNSSFAITATASSSTNGGFNGTYQTGVA